MTTAPTTPTATDKTMELRRIADEIAVMKAGKERLENETKLAVAASTEAREGVRRLKTELQGLETTVSDVTRETREFVATCARIMREAGDSTIETLELVKQLAAVADKAHENIETAKADASRIHEGVIRDLTEIDRKNGDLDIYHSRLRAHFEKHLPGQVITI